ncbi:MAG: hypothetical protein JWM56_147 [Candidatus Peribacteria bacterium]|nr:hypothetical protein [Candidatus Peribacteria bacterium]
MFSMHTQTVLPILRKIWPAIPAFVIFIGVSYLLQSHLTTLEPLLKGSSPALGMFLYVLLGIATVAIPFGSLLPFIPIAVLLWGWLPTAFLTLLSWVLGGQILFEASRYFGKPLIGKYMQSSRLDSIAHLVQGNFLHSLFIRMIVHGDIVSYAFGIFTTIGRWEFLAVTALGVAPGAFMYAYFGSLPFQYQLGMALLGLLLITSYYIVDLKKPDFFRSLRFAR